MINLNLKKMKLNNILVGFLIFGGCLFNAQIAIGKQSVNGVNTILDFAGATATEASTDPATTNENGIILPAVTASPSYAVTAPTTNNPNNGTFVFDRALRMVRMFTNGAWVNLSDAAGNDIPADLNNPSTGLNGGVIIGSSTTAASGVLVLESADKAMVLPHVRNPHTTVKSPYPGMMCYDTQSNSLAVYDGVKWNYWR
ncbi:hypothetical protein IX39_18740 [Chryseobacterium formosense]|uniref:Uncharacterized protein n=2 Tax=Chryseobacterium formosense TaxID=236814 RepID=A0A085Z031_9FLAO|nr:hypothetical protein IX39_18740 [Chryseobacterium formosense]